MLTAHETENMVVAFQVDTHNKYTIEYDRGEVEYRVSYRRMKKIDPETGDVIEMDG